MDNDSIKRNITLFRKQRKMTQLQMAELMEIDRTSYREIEKGATSLVSEKLFRIADILELSPERLMLGPEDGSPDVELHSETDNLKDDLAKTKAFYEDLVGSLQQKLELLCKINESQAQTIRSQFEMIEMLQRQN